MWFTAMILYMVVSLVCILLYTQFCYILTVISLPLIVLCGIYFMFNYPRRARSALGVDTVLTLDVCLYVCMLVL